MLTLATWASVATSVGGICQTALPGDRPWKGTVWVERGPSWDTADGSVISAVGLSWPPTASPGPYPTDHFPTQGCSPRPLDTGAVIAWSPPPHSHRLSASHRLLKWGDLGSPPSWPRSGYRLPLCLAVSSPHGYFTNEMSFPSPSLICTQLPQ